MSSSSSFKLDSKMIKAHLFLIIFIKLVHSNTVVPDGAFRFPISTGTHRGFYSISVGYFKINGTKSELAVYYIGSLGSIIQVDVNTMKEAYKEIKVCFGGDCDDSHITTVDLKSKLACGFQSKQSMFMCNRFNTSSKTSEKAAESATINPVSLAKHAETGWATIIHDNKLYAAGFYGTTNRKGFSMHKIEESKFNSLEAESTEFFANDAHFYHIFKPDEKSKDDKDIDHIYVLFQEEYLEDHKKGKRGLRIARVCPNDPAFNLKDKFNYPISFIKTQLRCEDPAELLIPNIHSTGPVYDLGAGGRYENNIASITTDKDGKFYFCFYPVEPAIFKRGYSMGRKCANPGKEIMHKRFDDPEDKISKCVVENFKESKIHEMKGCSATANFIMAKPIKKRPNINDMPQFKQMITFRLESKKDNLNIAIVFGSTKDGTIVRYWFNINQGFGCFITEHMIAYGGPGDEIREMKYFPQIRKLTVITKYMVKSFGLDNFCSMHKERTCKSAQDPLCTWNGQRCVGVVALKKEDYMDSETCKAPRTWTVRSHPYDCKQIAPHYDCVNSTWCGETASCKCISFYCLTSQEQCCKRPPNTQNKLTDCKRKHLTIQLQCNSPILEDENPSENTVIEDAVTKTPTKIMGLPPAAWAAIIFAIILVVGMSIMCIFFCACGEGAKARRQKWKERITSRLSRSRISSAGSNASRAGSAYSSSRASNASRASSTSRTSSASRASTASRSTTSRAN